MENQNNGISALSQMMESSDQEKLAYLDIDQIITDPDQDRQNFELPEVKAAINEMVKSILSSESKMIRRPIEVFEVEHNKFQIIAGEMRYRSSVLAKADKIPALIRKNIDSKQRSIDMLTENLVRTSLSPIDLAKGIRRRIDHEGFTREDILVHTGKSKAWLSRLLNLLDMPDDVQKLANDSVVRDPYTLLKISKLDDAKRNKAVTDLNAGKTTAAEVLGKKKKVKKDKTVNESDYKTPLRVSVADLQLMVRAFIPEHPQMTTKEEFQAGLQQLILKSKK